MRFLPLSSDELDLSDLFPNDPRERILCFEIGGKERFF